jgi:hypothetical protein
VGTLLAGPGHGAGARLARGQTMAPLAGVSVNSSALRPWGGHDLAICMPRSPSCIFLDGCCRVLSRDARRASIAHHGRVSWSPSGRELRREGRQSLTGRPERLTLREGSAKKRCRAICRLVWASPGCTESTMLQQVPSSGNILSLAVVGLVFATRHDLQVSEPVRRSRCGRRKHLVTSRSAAEEPFRFGNRGANE